MPAPLLLRLTATKRSCSTTSLRQTAAAMERLSHASSRYGGCQKSNFAIASLKRFPIVRHALQQVLNDSTGQSYPPKPQVVPALHMQARQASSSLGELPVLLPQQTLQLLSGGTGWYFPKVKSLTNMIC